MAEPTLGALLDYGVLGLLVVSFVVGWAVPGYIHKQTSARLERLEEQFLTEVIPALTRAADALAALTGPRQSRGE